MRTSYRKLALVGVGLATAALVASASVVAGGAVRMPAALRGLASASLATDKRHPDADPPKGYAENLPKFASMLDVLLAWNPDDPAEPMGGTKFDTLEVIDWASDGAMERATELRNLEIPFKIKNMAELVRPLLWEAVVRRVPTMQSACRKLARASIPCAAQRMPPAPAHRWLVQSRGGSLRSWPLCARAGRGCEEMGRRQVRDRQHEHPQELHH